MELDNVLKNIGSQYVKEFDRYYLSDRDSESMYQIKCYNEQNYICVQLAYHIDEKLNNEITRRKLSLLNEACYSGNFTLNDSELVYKSALWFVNEPSLSELDVILTEMLSKMKAVLSMLKGGF